MGSISQKYLHPEDERTDARTGHSFTRWIQLVRSLHGFVRPSNFVHARSSPPLTQSETGRGPLGSWHRYLCACRRCRRCPCCCRSLLSLYLVLRGALPASKSSSINNRNAIASKYVSTKSRKVGLHRPLSSLQELIT